MLCKGRGAVDARQVEYACASMHHDEYRKYLIIRLCPINSAVSSGVSTFRRCFVLQRIGKYFGPGKLSAVAQVSAPQECPLYN